MDDLMVEFDRIIEVLSERVQTRPGLQGPTAVAAIHRIRELRGSLATLQGESPKDVIADALRAGLELQRATEDLEDCAGESFPRIATGLYGIAEELQRLGGVQPENRA